MLGAIGRDVVGAGSVRRFPGEAPAAGDIPEARHFHLDHLRAQFGEEGAHQGPGQHRGELDDLQSLPGTVIPKWGRDIMRGHARKLGLGQGGLVGVDGALTRELVLHDGSGVGRRAPFGNPAADIGSRGVELLQLALRIEDPEVRGGVASAARSPLPSSDIGGELEVQQLLGEIAFPQSPIEQEVLAEETGDHHAHAVVHEPGGIQFAHAGVHEGIARSACAPGGEMAIVMAPGNPVVLGPEGILGAVGEMVEDGLIEFAPDELGEPLVAVGKAQSGLGPHRDGAEPQVEAHPGGPDTCVTTYLISGRWSFKKFSIKGISFFLGVTKYTPFFLP